MLANHAPTWAGVHSKMLSGGDEDRCCFMVDVDMPPPILFIFFIFFSTSSMIVCDVCGNKKTMERKRYGKEQKIIGSISVYVEQCTYNNRTTTTTEHHNNRTTTTTEQQQRGTTHCHPCCHHPRPAAPDPPVPKSTTLGCCSSRSSRSSRSCPWRKKANATGGGGRKIP